MYDVCNTLEDDSEEDDSEEDDNDFPEDDSEYGEDEEEEEDSDLEESETELEKNMIRRIYGRSVGNSEGVFMYITLHVHKLHVSSVSGYILDGDFNYTCTCTMYVTL